MKYRFLYLAFVIISATVSSAFATSSKKKIVIPSVPEAGVMNWMPKMPLDNARPPHTHTPVGAMARLAVGTTPTYSSSLSVNAGIYYLKMLGGHVGIYAGTEYMQNKFTITTASPVVEYAYKHAQIPIILTYMPRQYVYVGVGAKYSYLLSATVGGKTIDLSNDKTFNRNGIGLIADLSFGWSVKSPRLGVQYVYNTGAALVGQNYNTIDVSIRVPFATKK